MRGLARKSNPRGATPCAAAGRNQAAPRSASGAAWSAEQLAKRWILWALRSANVRGGLKLVLLEVAEARRVINDHESSRTRSLKQASLGGIRGAGRVDC